MMSDTASISSVTVSPIGVIHSPYQEKFAVPRQPGLVNAINAQLELLPPYNDPHCVRGLEAFSHLWLMFLFHQNGTAEWHPTVRPPRLGGNQRVGVFATRSPFRPNPIGLSCVRLLGIEGAILRISDVDMLDGTPLLDIKPYLPDCDVFPAERTGWYANARERIQADGRFAEDSEIVY